MNFTELKEKLKTTFTTIDFRDKDAANGLHLEFSRKDNKDYKFYICVEPHWNSVLIGARLESDVNGYFWYDSADRTTEDDKEWEKWVVDYVFDTITTLVNYKTRIIQRDGLMFTSFKCEYFDTVWKVVTKNRAVRWTIQVPKIKGSKKIYE